MRTVFFHEDDYGMVQLLPASARQHCLDEMRQIETKHSSDDGEYGVSELHVLREPAPNFRSLRLSAEELTAVLTPQLPCFEKVLTGYSTHREHGPGIQAWGFDDHQAVFAQLGSDSYVEEVWLELGGVDLQGVQHWVRALQALPGAAELLLVDWFRHEVVPLVDEQRLTAYLQGQGSETVPES